MGSCITSNSKTIKRQQQSALPPAQGPPKRSIDDEDDQRLLPDRSSTITPMNRINRSEEVQVSVIHASTSQEAQINQSLLQKKKSTSNKEGKQPNFKQTQDVLPVLGAQVRQQTPEPGDVSPGLKPQEKSGKPVVSHLQKQKGLNLQPGIIRQFRIYNISSKSPVSLPYSKETQWQQILKQYEQSLHMSSFQQNIGGQNLKSLQNKRPVELMNHLEQITMHREIELMVRILSLDNRNWIQEQIKMSRRLAQMQPGSFDSLVVTREYLQLKEHFHWLVWAVSYYYFNIDRIEQFFQRISSQTKSESESLQTGRAKQQNMIQAEIILLFKQLKNLKNRLPSPISKKWTEGFAFSGVFFRMLPSDEGQYVKNEMKALKYIQTELIELNSIRNQLQEQNPKLAKQRSIYNQLILPLLGAVECGSFIVFASPVIFIPEYEDDSTGANDAITKENREPSCLNPVREMSLIQSKYRDRSLTTIYGQSVFLNRKHLSRNQRSSAQVEDQFLFLQENLGEIKDQMLQTMPLLKNLSKENVIPIMDFSDHTQTDLNLLVLHCFECIPTVSTPQSVAMVVPQDQGEPIKYLRVPDLSSVQLSSLQKWMQRDQVRDQSPVRVLGPGLNRRQSVVDESDFEEEDFDKPSKLNEAFAARSFTKHGFDLLVLSASNPKTVFGSREAGIIDGQGLTNKRAQQLFLAREQEFTFAGLFQTSQSALLLSMSQVALKQGGDGLTPRGSKYQKHSILRKNMADNYHTHQFGTMHDLQSEDSNICGNAFVVAENSSSSFKLKYAMINHSYQFPIEQIFMEQVQQIADTLENTDTIYNVQSLKELFGRKGINLRFQWVLLTKLKSNFHRELVMTHILVRIIKKIVNEEVKLKSQVFTSQKTKVPGPTLAERHRPAPKLRHANDQTCDQFMDNQQDFFKDTLVFITNTLLRRKFSKEKHVFDEALIGLFLNRLKIIPFVQEILAFSLNTGVKLMSDHQWTYLQSKQILDDIISSASQNPALFLNSLQRYFHIDIEAEFLRKSRQDKYLFLSQLTSQPMKIGNIQSVSLEVHSYFSIKEHCYLMLASEISKQQTETTQQKLMHMNSIGQNQNLRINIFRNQHSSKSRPVDLSINMHSLASMSSYKDAPNNALGANSGMIKTMEQKNQQHEILNNSFATDKPGNTFISVQSSQITQGGATKMHKQQPIVNQTPRQFNNINFSQHSIQGQNQESAAQQFPPDSTFPEMVMPCILYKVKTMEGSRQVTNLLPFYRMPNKDIFNKWVMYLESILNDVYSIDGTEGILLEALNYLALTIFFAESADVFAAMQSPLMSPKQTESMNSRRPDMLVNFDLDQFSSVCSKIMRLIGSTSKCPPEVLIMSQLICGLHFEQFQDDQTFPIESEKCYLTALICLFNLLGDPRGRGNLSSPIMLLPCWKLSLLSLCIENRKVHDSEFSEELFDATLVNLVNHKMKFRIHQNQKLKRVEHEKVMAQQNPRSAEAIAAKHKGKSPVHSQRKSQVDVKQLLSQYVVDKYELGLDSQSKSNNEFDITSISQAKTKNLVDYLGTRHNVMGVAKSLNVAGRQAEETKKGSNSGRKLSGHHSLLHGQLQDVSETNPNDIHLLLDEQPALSEFQKLNSPDAVATIPEVPFIHWSIYRQGIQNLMQQQGHKFAKNQKQLSKFLSQMYKNVLFTAVDKSILFAWLLKYNLVMFQSGTVWKNNQIKMTICFQSAQMISSRSSSKSFRQNESESSLSLSMQGSVISQTNGNKSFRAVGKTQNLGTYSSILSTDIGCINKADLHGVVYSWGADAQGQLGLDTYAHLTKKPAVQKVLYPRIVAALKNEFVKEICCGYQHTLAITINGNVYAWGSNESRQLGLGYTAPDFVRKPVQIQSIRNVVKVAAGNEHSVAINKNHELFTWGLATQTGQNDTLNRELPSRLEFFRSTKIIQVACGGLHTLAITKENKVFCWGSTEGGQLGLPIGLIQKICKTEDNAVKFPQQIMSLQDQVVTQVACGETHSIALCKSGAIFGWGMSLYGQLGLGFSSDSFEPGLGMEMSKVMEPRKIDTLNGENISKIYCGSTFTMFLTDKGELFGCGMNDLGQLGEDIYNDMSVLESAKMGQLQTSDITIPTQVSSLQGIQINSLACGESHVLAIDGDGDKKNMLWAWGQFKNGQLGLGEVTSKMNPRPVQNLAAGTINKVACGSAHSLALIGDASNVTTLSPNYYAANEVLNNPWQSSLD